MKLRRVPIQVALTANDTIPLSQFGVTLSGVWGPVLEDFSRVGLGLDSSAGWPLDKSVTDDFKKSPALPKSKDGALKL
jgi:hypothetical protein